MERGYGNQPVGFPAYLILIFNIHTRLHFSILLFPLYWGWWGLYIAFFGVFFLSFSFYLLFFSYPCFCGAAFFSFSLFNSFFLYIGV